MNRVIELACGNWYTHMLHTVCSLGIPDHVGEGISIKELSVRTETHEEALYRLMRALSTLGVFKEHTSRCFVHTDASLLLTSDHPNSLRSYCLLRGMPQLCHVWEYLPYSVKTGKPAINMYERFKSNKDEYMLFNKAMTSMTRLVATKIMNAHPGLFKANDRVCDIGGGSGELLKIVMDTVPVKGVVLDLPEVAKMYSHKDIDYVGASFFEKIDINADVYVLKYILHNWGDQECMSILSNIRDAMARNSGSRLLIIESVLSDSSYHKLLDIQMLLCLSEGAKERTQSEYISLIQSTGMKLLKTYDIPDTEINIVEISL